MIDMIEAVREVDLLCCTCILSLPPSVQSSLLLSLSLSPSSATTHLLSQLSLVANSLNSFRHVPATIVSLQVSAKQLNLPLDLDTILKSVLVGIGLKVAGNRIIAPLKPTNELRCLQSRVLQPLHFPPA